MRTLQKEHKEQAQCKDTRERKERTYVCVCVCVCACEEERDCRACDRLFGLRSPPPIGQCAACSVRMCVRARVPMDV